MKFISLLNWSIFDLKRYIITLFIINLIDYLKMWDVKNLMWSHLSQMKFIKMKKFNENHIKWNMNV